MAIKVAKRCEIDPLVSDIYRQSAAVALKHIYDKMKGMSPSRRPTYLQKTRGDIGRLNDIVKGISKPGRGMDLEMSRLRGLDFESITVQDIAGKKWLMAQTKNLIITLRDLNYREKVTGRRAKGSKYDHGDYKIYVDLNTIATTKISSLHFVPDLDPKCHSRHYHHTASWGRDSASDYHPVQMYPSSCWGGFSGPLATSLVLADLPELFRMLRIFVGRYNPGSPLGRPRFGKGKL